jgi:ABC-type nitrate/sulfonate/bicarbonate transport system substrate-binding protein
MSETVVQFLGLFATVIGAMIMLGLRRLVNYAIEKTEAKEAEKQAYQALLEGMAKAQEEIVREAKKAAMDGKLTKEEIQAAKTLALEHAKQIAVGPAKDLVMSWTVERADSLIKQFLTKVK